MWVIGGNGINDTNTIHVFNGIKWEEGPTLPEGYKDVNGLGAVEVNDILYILGKSFFGLITETSKIC